MEKALTKYFWVFNLTTLILIALFLANGTGELVVSKILEKMPQESDIAKGTTSRSTSSYRSSSSRFQTPDGDIILERNIFDSTAAPWEEEEWDTEAGIVTAEGELPLVPCPSSSTKLLATVASKRDPDWSFVTVAAGRNETQLYRIGDQLDNREISDITWRYLFMRGSSDECYIDLFGDGKELKRKKPKKAGPAGPDDLKSGIEVVSETERNVDRSLINKVIADPTQFAKSVRIRPYKRNGKVQGFKIRRVGKDSPLSLLGAKKGDVIKSVNGVELNSIDKALGLYQQLGTENQLNFDITRKGKPVQMKINIR